MRVSIEWFLLDNWLMNTIILLLASALSGLRFRPLLGVALALLGGIYALLALAVWPVLLFAPIRVAFGCVLAFGLRARGWKAYLRAALCVLAGAFLVGGVLLAVTYLLQAQHPGMGMQGSVLIGTIELRAVLLGGAVALLAPRLMRYLRANARVEEGYVRLRVTYQGRERTVRALVDTGNLLIEPITGLPVALLRDCWRIKDGYPVRYSAMGGTGEILCRHADRAEVYMNGTWRDIDIMIAHAPYPVQGADAILGNIALPPAEPGQGLNKKGETEDA